MFVTIQTEDPQSTKRPYPLHVNEDGTVGNQDVWKGEYTFLIGFQANRDVLNIDLVRPDWLAGEIDDAVGMYPVFTDARGGMFTMSATVDRVVQNEGTASKSFGWPDPETGYPDWLARVFEEAELDPMPANPSKAST